MRRARFINLAAFVAVWATVAYFACDTFESTAIALWR